MIQSSRTKIQLFNDRMKKILLFPLTNIKKLIYLCRKIIFEKMRLFNKQQPDTIEEARRYVANAKDILKERGKLVEDGTAYEDRKYVRAAGNYLWLGVLIALDVVFNVRQGKRTRPDVNDYREAVSNRDKKLLTLVNMGYETIHLSMNYDGNQSKAVCDEGFRLSNEIIERCERMAS